MKKVISTLLAFIVSPAFAAEVPTAEITYISPWTTHVDVKTNTAYFDPEECGAGTYYRVDLENDAGAQEKLSTLLAAFMGGKNVGLSITGCVGNAPKINGVRLYK